MGELTANAVRPKVGLWQVPLVFINPRRLFSRVEDVPAYAWTLTVLLLLVTLLGGVLVETGLIDREVDRRTERGIAEIEKQQLGVVEPSALREMFEVKRQEGEFLRLMSRAQVLVAAPLGTLVSLLVIASLFYAAVALTGSKPEWHTLLTITVFTSFVDVAAWFVRLAFVFRFRSLDVDTSLKVLAPFAGITDAVGGQETLAATALLAAIDPFRIWFWVVAAVGLSVTMQLRRWRAWLTCASFWLVAVLARTAIGFAVSQAVQV